MYPRGPSLWSGAGEVKRNGGEGTRVRAAVVRSPSL
jgi:hypothetical protein